MFSALAKSGGIIAATTAAVAGIGAGAAFEFAEHAEKFSSAMTQAGVAAHATNQELEDMEGFAKNKFLDSLNGSAITVAQSLKQLALEGFNAEESTQALSGAMTLMKISMGALDERASAGIVHDTLSQFGMAADESSELVDKLAFSMQHFGFRAEELQGTMSGLAAGAQLTGSSLDDVLVGVGLVHQVFPSATKAAASLNTAMNQLADTHHQQLIAATLGIDVTDKHTKKLRPLVDIMRDLSLKTQHMSEAQLSHTLETIAGGRAAGGLSAIIDGLRKGVVDETGTLLTGAKALDYYRKSLNESDGAAKKMGDALNNDLGGAIRALKNAISNAGVLFGEQFEKPFTSAIRVVNLAVRGLTQLFVQGGFSGEVLAEMDKAGNGGIKQFAITVFLWGKRIENFFSNLGEAFSSAFAPFRPILNTLLGSFRELGQVLGIVDQSASENGAAFDSFGKAGATVGSIIANIAGAVLPLLVGAMEIVIAAAETLRAVWGAIGPVIMSVGQIVNGVFEVISGLLTGNWKKMWDGFVDVVVGAAAGIIKIISGALGVVLKLVDGVGAAFGKDLGLNQGLEKFMTAAGTGAASVAPNLKSIVSAPSGGDSFRTSPALAVLARQEAFRRNDNADPGERPSFLDQPPIHVHVHSHMDGSKIAEGLAVVKRSDASRSYKQVDDHGGDH